MTLLDMILIVCAVMALCAVVNDVYDSYKTEAKTRSERLRAKNKRRSES